MAIILITGADGQLGNELRVVSKNYYGYDFVFTDVSTLDITNNDKTAEFINQTKPDWIVNCAAYNLVDKAEEEPDKALLINGTAVKNITEVIKGSECRFIHISTDYVYDGKSNIPYNENIPAAPLVGIWQIKAGRRKIRVAAPGFNDNQDFMVIFFFRKEFC